MKKEYNWLVVFKEWMKDDDFIFACNVCSYNDDWIRYFKKLEKLGGAIKLLDHESITLTIPEKSEEIFLYILTEMPMPTYTGYHKRSRKLTLSWS